MAISKKQHTQQESLNKEIWNISNSLRGQMESFEFKNYILGLIFYRFISEKTEELAAALLERDKRTYSEAWKDEEYQDVLSSKILQHIGCIVEPQYLFSTILKEIQINENRNFNINLLQEALNAITDSAVGTASQKNFQHLFADLNLSSLRLGRNEKSRSHLISEIMISINNLSLTHHVLNGKTIGDVYEDLIAQFAESVGKKGGEFYTPKQVSKILAKIVSLKKSKIESVYDPTCGSGSLLLSVAEETKAQKLYGQEILSTMHNLARMNLMIHGIAPQRFDIRNGDALEEPQHQNLRFEAIVANPPYNIKWGAESKFLSDERYKEYGKLAPKSKAEFAFIQHMIYHLADNGTMAVILPHGVLFRGAAEGVIRKYMIKEKNYIDTIIGLPSNIFYGTSIPVCIVVFRKQRKYIENILFINASQEFEKGKKRNFLTDENVEKILKTYIDRAEVRHYSCVVAIEEIEANDYNLNISRYVDMHTEKEEVDLQAMKFRIGEINKEIEEIDLKMIECFNELRLLNNRK